VRLAVGQAFRKPSFFNSSIHLTDIEAQPAFPALGEFFSRAVGNPDLENESITSFEAGYRGRFLDTRLVVEADAFYNRYRDTINLNIQMVNDDWGLPDLEASHAKYLNSGREADSVGGSLSVTTRLAGDLRAGANYTYRYSWYTSEPGGTAADGEGEKGDRVTWEPAHLANFNFSYHPESGLRCGLGWHGRSSKRGYVVATGSTWDPRVLVPLPATWFMSAVVAYKAGFGSGWVEMGVRATNLLHSPYHDIPAITDKPWIREYRLGAERIGRRIFLFLRGSV
jgi:outer membrane receptor protein involved in Fe transport